MISEQTPSNLNPCVRKLAVWSMAPSAPWFTVLCPGSRHHCWSQVATWPKYLLSSSTPILTGFAAPVSLPALAQSFKRDCSWTHGSLGSSALLAPLVCSPLALLSLFSFLTSSSLLCLSLSQSPLFLLPLPPHPSSLLCFPKNPSLYSGVVGVLCDG